MTESDKWPTLDEDEIAQCINGLAKQPDRAQVIIMASWFDHLLDVKLRHFFTHGNFKARCSLFSPTGGFATFSSKIDVCYCAGWLKGDMHHDLHNLRKLRNEFAHTFARVSLDTDPMMEALTRFQTPTRHHKNWERATTSHTLKPAMRGIMIPDDPPVLVMHPRAFVYVSALVFLSICQDLQLAFKAGQTGRLFHFLKPTGQASSGGQSVQQTSRGDSSS